MSAPANDGAPGTPRPSRQVARAEMRRATKIQWTQRTWQVTSGCREWSPGCLNCYARLDARRMGSNPNEKVRKRYAALVVLQNNRLRWTGEVRQLPEQLHVPMHWRAPTRVFVNSLSDLFQEGVSFEYIAAVFGVMAMCARHTFQVLTKRPDRMRAWFGWIAEQAAARGLDPRTECVVEARAHGVTNGFRDVANAWPLPNVWLGTSVEDQRRLDERLPELLQVPAAVRWLSCEPLLEAIDLSAWIAGGGIHWAVIGGESGRGARPFHLAWARSLLAQCRRARVLPFVKQLGAQVLGRDCEHGRAEEPCGFVDRKGGDMREWSEDLRVREMPEVARA